MQLFSFIIKDEKVMQRQGVGGSGRKRIKLVFILFVAYGYHQHYHHYDREINWHNNDSTNIFTSKLNI